MHPAKLPRFFRFLILRNEQLKSVSIRFFSELTLFGPFFSCCNASEGVYQNLTLPFWAQEGLCFYIRKSFFGYAGHFSKSSRAIPFASMGHVLRTTDWQRFKKIYSRLASLSHKSHFVKQLVNFISGQNHRLACNMRLKFCCSFS